MKRQKQKTNEASEAEWRQFAELVNKLCDGVSDLKRGVCRLESKVRRRKTRRTASLDPVPQERVHAS